MLIVQLNRNPNQEMMVSRINKRKERKIGLQVCLGVGNLRLGEDLRQGRATHSKVQQRLVNLGLWVCLGEHSFA